MTKQARPLKTDTDGLNPLAQWIRAERVRLKLTQEELGVELGFSPRYIRPLEKGLKRPSAEALQKMAAFFGKEPPAEARRFLGELVWEDRSKVAQKRQTASPFGLLLREERCRRGLTQKQMASALGHGSGYIQRIETGSRRISEKELRKVCDLLGYETIPFHWKEALVASDQVFNPRTEKSPDKLPPLGEEIRAMRKKKGWSAQDLAERCGLKRLWLLNIENGRLGVSDERLFEIAKGLGYAETPAHWFELRRQSRQELQSNKGEMNNQLSSFGRVLRTIRKERHCSQVLLSQVLGKDGNFIHEVEYGRISITEAYLDKIATYLGGEKTRQRLMEALAMAAQWQKARGIAPEELPDYGRLQRIKRHNEGLSIREMAEKEHLPEWKIYERERGKRLVWKAKREKR